MKFLSLATFALILSVSAGAQTQYQKSATKAKRKPSSAAVCNVTNMLASHSVLFRDSSNKIWISTSERVGNFLKAQGMESLGAIVPGTYSRDKIENLGPCEAGKVRHTYRASEYPFSSTKACHETWAKDLKATPYDVSQENFGSMETMMPMINGEELEVCTDGNRVGACIQMGASAVDSCLDKLFY